MVDYIKLVRSVRTVEAVSQEVIFAHCPHFTQATSELLLQLEVSLAHTVCLATQLGRFRHYTSCLLSDLFISLFCCFLFDTSFDVFILLDDLVDKNGDIVVLSLGFPLLCLTNLFQVSNLAVFFLVALVLGQFFQTIDWLLEIDVIRVKRLLVLFT